MTCSESVKHQNKSTHTENKTTFWKIHVLNSNLKDHHPHGVSIWGMFSSNIMRLPYFLYSFTFKAGPRIHQKAFQRRKRMTVLWKWRFNIRTPSTKICCQARRMKMMSRTKPQTCLPHPGTPNPLGWVPQHAETKQQPVAHFRPIQQLFCMCVILRGKCQF